MGNRKNLCPEDCGNLKSEIAEYCRPCSDRIRVGPRHGCWKGGRIIDGEGYAKVYKPDDPRANLGRYMKEHIVVMEEKLGRQLLSHESVHHKNGNRADNRIENLELWSKHQPAGQRVEDKLKWAYEIIELYGGGERNS